MAKKKLGPKEWGGRSVRLILAAAARITAAGEPLTCPALCRATRLSRASVSSRISQLKQRDRWPYEVASPTRAKLPAKEKKPRGEKGRQILAAAAAILARGEPLTRGSIARECGIPAKLAGSRIDSLRQWQKWPHRMDRVAPTRRTSARALPRRAEGHRHPDEAEAALIALAAGLADDEGVVCAADLAEAAGLTLPAMRLMARRLALRGHWRFALTGTRRDPDVDPKSLAEAIAEVQAEVVRGMGDGRMERDDPGMAGGCYSGRRAPTPEELAARESEERAAECRELVLHWKFATGRLAPPPAPAREHKPRNRVPHVGEPKMERSSARRRDAIGSMRARVSHQLSSGGD